MNRLLERDLEDEMEGSLECEDMVDSSRSEVQPSTLDGMAELTVTPVETNDLEDVVTIIYWPPSRRISSYNSDSFKSLLSFGHIALQTHVGGRNNVGHYVSFWPGKCVTFWPEDEENDPNKCYKDKSHFHSRAEDDILYRNKTPVVVNLQHQNTQAVNHYFKAFIDHERNAKDHWTIRNNCSDVVMNLLEVSDPQFLEKASRYDIKILYGLGFIATSFSVLMIDMLRGIEIFKGEEIQSIDQYFLPCVHMIRSQAEALFLFVYHTMIRMELKVFFWRKDTFVKRCLLNVLRKTLECLRTKYLNILFGNASVYRHHPIEQFIVGYLMYVTIGAASAFSIFYLHTLLSYSKSHLSNNIKHNIALVNAKRAVKYSLIGVSTWVAVKILANYQQYNIQRVIPVELVARYLYFPLFEVTLSNFPNFTLLGTLSIPLLVMGAVLSINYFRDTTVTPQDVFSIAAALSKKNSTNSFPLYEKTKALLKLLNKNKFELLVIAGAAVCASRVGLFVYRNLNTRTSNVATNREWVGFR